MRATANIESQWLLCRYWWLWSVEGKDWVITVGPKCASVSVDSETTDDPDLCRSLAEVATSVADDSAIFAAGVASTATLSSN